MAPSPSRPNGRCISRASIKPKLTNPSGSCLSMARVPVLHAGPMATGMTGPSGTNPNAWPGRKREPVHLANTPTVNWPGLISAWLGPPSLSMPDHSRPMGLASFSINQARTDLPMIRQWCQNERAMLLSDMATFWRASWVSWMLKTNGFTTPARADSFIAPLQVNTPEIWTCVVRSGRTVWM